MFHSTYLLSLSLYHQHRTCFQVISRPLFTKRRTPMTTCPATSDQSPRRLPIALQPVFTSSAPTLPVPTRAQPTAATSLSTRSHQALPPVWPTATSSLLYIPANRVDIVPTLATRASQPNVSDKSPRLQVTRFILVLPLCLYSYTCTHH